MPTIQYFLNPLSPFVYLAGARPAEIARRHGADIVYRPLDMNALLQRTGGKPFDERHESRRTYRLQELRREAAKQGVPINPKALYRGTNSAPACYAIIAAQSAGGGDTGALVAGLARACWAEERDIADDGVIREALGDAGFDPAVADRGLLTGAEAYGANLEEAVLLGVFGVPWFTVGDEHFWGQDRLGDLDAQLAVVKEGGA